MDLKKEIRMSDLFKRSPKAARAAEPFDETTEPDSAESGSARPEKALRLSLRRRPKEPKEWKAPKEPKARRGKSSAPALAEVPLMRAFNLLPKDDPREARQARPSTAKLVLAVVCFVALAGLGSMFMILSAGVADKRQLRDELEAQVQALQAPEPAGEEPVAPIDPAVAQEQNQRTAAVATALANRVAWDRVLRDLSLVTPADVWLSGLIVTPGEVATPPPPDTSESDPTAAPTPAQPSSITINGYAGTQEGVARMLARLAVVPELTGVTLLSSATALIGETEVYQFAVSATVKLREGATA